jgi:predicted kinase
LSDRRAFSSTFGLVAPVGFIECQAPASVLLERAARRADDPRRVSDADAAVVRRELGSFEPLDEVSADAHVALRADRPVGQVVGDVDAVLDRRLEHRGRDAT